MRGIAPRPIALKPGKTATCSLLEPLEPRMLLSGNTGAALAGFSLNASAPTNSAPVLDPCTFQMPDLAKGQTTSHGVKLADLLSTHASSIHDANANALQGIAVVGVNNLNGTWQYSMDSGITWSTLAGVSTAARLLPANNATYIRFVPKSTFQGSTAIQFCLWDQTSGTAGGVINTVTTHGGSTSISLNSASAVTWVGNHAPVLDNTGNMALDQVITGTPNPGTQVSKLIASAGGDRITDVDSLPKEGIAVVAADSTHGAWQYSLDNKTWLTLKGYFTAARLLSADAYVRFVPNTGYTGSIASGISFCAWDQTQGVNGGTLDAMTRGSFTAISSAIETASVSVVTATLNSAPVLDNSGAMTLQAGSAGTKVSDLIAGAGGDRIIDANAGAVEGIAVVAADTTHGTWQYNINGTTWITFKGFYTAATLLSADAFIRFVPAFGYTGTIANAITFRAWDQTQGVNGGTMTTMTNGGTSAFSTATETASVIIS